MFSILVTALALAGASFAASSSSSTSSGPTSTSTDVSFAFPAGVADAYVPTSGVSGTVWNVTESTTTIIFSCPTAKPDGNDTAGALCAADGSDGPVKVEYADDYFSMGFEQWFDTRAFAPRTTLKEPATIAGEMHCAITGSVTTASPVCTMNITSIPTAFETAEVMAVERCWEEDVAGPQSGVQQGEYNTVSVGACMSSVSASPTTAFTVTRNPKYNKYWTVTVTEIAAGVALTSDASASLSTRLSAAAIVVLAIVAVAL